MIIDYNYPTLTAEGWRVKVHKTTLRGKTYIQSMVFEDKDDAFRFHEPRHIFLDELPENAVGRKPKSCYVECGIFCTLGQQ